MANRIKFREELRKQFLEMLSEDSNVSAAARWIGMSRQHLYAIRDKDPVFAKQWDEAVKLGIDALEDEAKRRAVKGWAEPVYYKGEICGHVQKYSDYLLGLLLRGHFPDKYVERTKQEGALTISLENRLQEVLSGKTDDTAKRK